MVALMPLRTLMTVRGVLLHWREALVLLLLAAVAVVVVRNYLGTSPGPYGVCYGSNGRSIPCELQSP